MFMNPGTKGEWRDKATEANLQPDSIYVAERSYHSASKLTLKEFLYFKVIWSQKTVDDVKLEDLVSRQVVELIKSTDFSDCTAGIGTKDPHRHLQNKLDEEHIFVIPQYFMHLIQTGFVGNTDNTTPKAWKSRLRKDRDPKQPYNEEEASDKTLRLVSEQADSTRPETTTERPVTPPPNRVKTEVESLAVTPGDPKVSPRTEYEVTVNMALVTFLSAIRLRCPYLEQGHWLADQKPLYIFDTQGKSLLEARVDGYLKKEKTSGVFGIIEVKPHVRTFSTCDIQWQEAAQMVAWISMAPGEKANGVFSIPGDFTDTRRRFMISQDRDEIYVTIATYGSEYEAFLAKRRSDVSPKMPTADGGMIETTPIRQPSATNKDFPGLFKYPKIMFGSGATSLTKSMGAMKLEEKPGDDDDDDSDEQVVLEHQYPSVLKKKGNPSLDKGKGSNDSTSENTGAGRKNQHIKKVDGFLKMTSFGPYKIDSPEHMALFCKMAAGLTKAVLSQNQTDEKEDIF